MDKVKLLGSLQRATVEARGCELDEVQAVMIPAKRMLWVMEQLGLESIDFLEIGFQVEKDGFGFDTDALGDHMSEEENRGLTIDGMMDGFFTEI